MNKHRKRSWKKYNGQGKQTSRSCRYGLCIIEKYNSQGFFIFFVASAFINFFIYKLNPQKSKGGNMNYKVNIWKDDSLKREIVYTADNDIQAIQMASAATPDGCRSTYEEITEEQNHALWKRNLWFKTRRPSKSSGLKGKQKTYHLL